MTCAEMDHSFLKIISLGIKIYNPPASIKILFQLFIEKTSQATMEACPTQVDFQVSWTGRSSTMKFHNITAKIYQEAGERWRLHGC